MHEEFWNIQFLSPSFLSLFVILPPSMKVPMIEFLSSSCITLFFSFHDCVTFHRLFYGQKWYHAGLLNDLLYRRRHNMIR